MNTPSRARIFLAPATARKSIPLKPGQVRCPMCHKPFMATQDGFPRGHKDKGYDCVGARYMDPQTPEPYPTEPTEESATEALDTVTQAA